MGPCLLCALAFFLVATGASKSCSATSNVRFSYDGDDSTASCKLTGVYFYDITSEKDGGAIYIHTDGEFSISAALFLRCSSGKDGGAAWADTEWVDVLNSCAVNCSAVDGSVLWCEPNEECGIRDDSFVSAVSSNHGAVYGVDEGQLLFDRVNFTACSAMNGGSAFALWESKFSFDGKYLILLSLKGKRGIESKCGRIQSLQFCNIYHNIIDSSGCFLWCSTHGLKVSDCIFRDNEGSLIGIESLSTKSIFTFQNCVFSGDYPSQDSLYSLGSACVSETVTDSWPFHGVTGMSDCPTNTQVSIPSPTPTVMIRTLTIDTATLSSQFHPSSSTHHTTGFHCTASVSESLAFRSTDDFSMASSLVISMIWPASSAVNSSLHLKISEIDFHLASHDLLESAALFVSAETNATAVFSATSAAIASLIFHSSAFVCPTDGFQSTPLISVCANLFTTDYSMSSPLVTSAIVAVSSVMRPSLCLESYRIDLTIASHAFLELTTPFFSAATDTTIIFSLTSTVIPSRVLVSDIVLFVSDSPTFSPSAFLIPTVSGLSPILDFTAPFSVSTRFKLSAGDWQSPVFLATQIFGGSDVSSSPEAQTIGTALIGGMIGGICVILFVICLVFLLYRRRLSSDEESYSSRPPVAPSEMNTVHSQFMEITFVSPETRDPDTVFADLWIEAVHESCE
jgi:hypothetical protein